MLHISFSELILRAIPEEFLIIWACYVLSKTEFQIKRYLLSSTLSVFLIYLVRSLPITLGINTLLMLGVLILLNNKINKMQITKAIKVAVGVLLLEMMCEIINIGLIKYVFKLDIVTVFASSSLKIIYGIPSLILLFCFTLLLKYLLNKKKIFNNTIPNVSSN